ncbi:rod-binding protein [Acidomonas methanolica]|uniref:Chemotactic signal-response protein CheL n=1 Tax=Acidomonas methanolica NBRC 104435 TaxID=1231351 RepID=A0A023D1G8_ACIMT|nr:rod-binding protein [Acidomonas methanolica]MBU2653322.1 rod-binding protein [Acidomonas methanolica]TCS32273.1 rod binding protein [Acidomonas methanolica]GAJ27646.1 chemotactic signal-response protein CheL [Acidomonas methanolica NBRC 104435]GBQ54035.1 chemotactic signal-response protein CheL [Acidomonas methanolica]GEK97708.1 hypothetical protein AME01nite_02070 [Acidomonas methanolica NBRC 104435]
MTTIPSVASHASPANASAPDPQTQAKTWKAAQDFEAMTINEMLQPMFAAAEPDDNGLFGGGIGEKQFRPMLINEMAKTMEQTGGLGLAPAIYRQMLALQEKK